MPLTLEEVMVRIRQMEQNVRAGEKEKNGQKKSGPSEEEIRRFIQEELEGQGEKSRDSRAARHVADLMARSPRLKRELRESLPTADDVRKKKMEQLREDARRTGMKKLLQDFRARKKRAAQAELKRIAQDKRRSEGEREISEKEANRSISAGRGRHIGTFAVQPSVNDEALGTKKERHDKRYELPDYKEGSPEINLRTERGMLKGRCYVPDPKQNTGKVAIVFSGSSGPAGKYATGIIDKYLRAGASVICMDYRGFGNSKSLSKSGEEVRTYPSEQSVYQDGRDMLHYVIDKDKLNVKPENVILHGFSMGGAVASKVAADFTQEQQKQALEEGKTAHKLGGIVLHSPMDSMADVATRQKNCVMGFGGWAFGGGYNTRSHMQRLHRLDPDIPVHYVSGVKEATDDYGRPDPDNLDLNVTKLHQDPKAQFRNSSVHIGEEGHTGDNFRAYDILPIVKDGRNAQLAGPEQGLQQGAPQLG